MDSSDTPPPPPDASADPPKKEKKIVLPKKKRKFSRTLRKTEHTAKAAQLEEEDVPEPPQTTAASSVIGRVLSQGSARRISNSELTAEVKRLHSELVAAQDELASRAREVETLTKKNKLLSDSTSKARTDLREARKATSLLEKSHKRQFTELEERAEQAEVSAAAYYDVQLEKHKVSNLYFTIVNAYYTNLILMHCLDYITGEV